MGQWGLQAGLLIALPSYTISVAPPPWFALPLPASCFPPPYTAPYLALAATDPAAAPLPHTCPLATYPACPPRHLFPSVVAFTQRLVEVLRNQSPHQDMDMGEAAQRLTGEWCTGSTL